MLKKMIWLMLLAGVVMGPLTACETAGDVVEETGESLDTATDDLNEAIEN